MVESKAHSASVSGINSFRQLGLISKDRLKLYYYLTKPGIVYSNVMTGLAGYLFGSHFHINWFRLVAFLVGLALIIASACVFNNYLDRSIDARMKRTKNRALVTGKVPLVGALIYGSLLALVGFYLLHFTNYLTVSLGILAIFSYVFVYGVAKRRSVHGTLVGTLPGAASLVAGYTAYTNKLDITTAVLLLIMISWQMAHFYSIAVYRLSEYRSAGLPVWPAVMGIKSTKFFIRLYIIAFIIACLLINFSSHLSFIYSFVIIITGLYWLKLALDNKPTVKAEAWARKLFFWSLITILVFSLMLPLSNLLV